MTEQSIGRVSIEHILPCLAFSVKMADAQVDVMKCQDLFKGEYTERRRELFRLLKDSGYSVSSVFVD